MYLINGKNISSKYVILYATQKRQICKPGRVNGAPQSLSDFIRICLFYISQNTKNVVLKFCTIAGYSVGYI